MVTNKRSTYGYSLNSIRLFSGVHPMNNWIAWDRVKQKTVSFIDILRMEELIIRNIHNISHVGECECECECEKHQRFHFSTINNDEKNTE